ncbi:MAG: DoxX family rane protein [Chlorobi bacterium]|nr:DoxX family rane protein [Chlorobiota bacterium]
MHGTLTDPFSGYGYSSTLNRSVTRYIFGISLALAGLNHFINPAGYVRIIPPYLPFPQLLVGLSGLAELLLGVLILFPRYMRLAAWGSIALLIAVFPANIHMALHPSYFPGIDPAILWLRLPLQAVFIAWAYRYTRPAYRP